jgi:TonB family protein
MSRTSQAAACSLPCKNRGQRPSTALFCLALGVLLSNPVLAHADDRTVVHKVPPTYPELAKRMHITGTVKVVTTIDASGAVTKVDGQGSNKILAAAAEDAVKHWKFAAGSGVDTMTIQINFDTN